MKSIHNPNSSQYIHFDSRLLNNPRLIDNYCTQNKDFKVAINPSNLTQCAKVHLASNSFFPYNVNRSMRNMK